MKNHASHKAARRFGAPAVEGTVRVTRTNPSCYTFGVISPHAQHISHLETMFHQRVLHLPRNNLTARKLELYKMRNKT